jgi:inhibitor of growth protein 4
MASYLRKHVDRVADVPAQLQRFFKLIRDLDEKAALLQAEVDERARQRLQAAANAGVGAHAAGAGGKAAGGGNPPANKKARTDGAVGTSSAGGQPNNTTAVLGAEVEAGALKVLSLAEEKMRVAAQVYDTVDAHIRALDADLRVLEASIRGDRDALNVGDGETAHGLLGEPLPAGASAAAFGGGGGTGGGAGGGGGGDGGRVKRKYTRRKGGEGGGGDGQQQLKEEQQNQEQEQMQDDDEAAAAAAAAAAANADSREPRYCVCNGVSYGDMIACDNPDCLIEWFHYACVGIKAQPKGRWYCPECTKMAGGGGGAGGAHL